MTQLNPPESSAAQREEREMEMPDGLIREMIADLPLPQNQKKAMTLLIYGNAPSHAAHAAGVHRGTLYRWMKEDPAFAGALADCKAALRRDARQQIESLTHDCVNILFDAVVQRDRRMAFRILKSLGVFAGDEKDCRRT